MESLSDRQIIAYIKQGKLEYFEPLVKKYTIKIYSFVSKKLYDKGEVEDIVQNTFLKFYKSISRYDESRPLLPYLFEIAKNEVRMYIRSRKTTVPLDDALEIQEEKELELEGEDVVIALDQLSVEQKKALLLLADGYSYEEIARKFKKPINTIRTIIRRGRLKLAKLKK